jgi:lipopolysaccharide/colanic/teichoic acid biosynthesis glycosyltransferase
MELLRGQLELARGTAARQFGPLLSDVLKRDLDFAGALCLLLLATPIGILIALLVAMDGGPVFYRHCRVGRNGQLFRCLKFRTMVMDAEECLSEYLRLHPESVNEWQGEQKLTRDPRVTGIGSMLRKLSLDELPQLWNVLVGEMSLVGPRPVTEGELREKYGSQANLVTSIKPGLTGLWQISGRNDTVYQQRVAMDVSYVRSRTLLLDLLILLRTPRRVLAGTGAR